MFGNSLRKHQIKSVMLQNVGRYLLMSKQQENPLLGHGTNFLHMLCIEHDIEEVKAF